MEESGETGNPSIHGRDESVSPMHRRYMLRGRCQNAHLASAAMNGNGLRRFSLEIHRARPRRAVEESPSEMAHVHLKRGLVPDEVSSTRSPLLRSGADLSHASSGGVRRGARGQLCDGIPELLLSEQRFIAQYHVEHVIAPYDDPAELLRYTAVLAILKRTLQEHVHV